jgi:hypothetical protein
LDDRKQESRKLRYNIAKRWWHTFNSGLAKKINLSNVSRRRPDNFARETMILWLRNRQAAGEPASDSEVCLENRDKALAIWRTFGSWAKALAAATV